jgi:DNA-binding transcriptional MerR regulator
MPKPKRLWKVNELIRHTGLTRQTIHNYTLLGLIEAAEWTDGGHRLFDGTVFERLQRIERLKRSGKRLQEIAALLNRPRATRRRGGRTSGHDDDDTTTRGEAHAEGEQPDDPGE